MCTLLSISGTVPLQTRTPVKSRTPRVVQGGVPTDQFITKKLWGFYSEPPFMHNGRATTITEAILMHGGEAQAAREAFTILSQGERNQLIECLKSLQVL